MIKEDFTPSRENKVVTHSADLVIVGGGLSGVCAAISAARKGLQVVLIQDRPVLGGNSSSEVRLWILGATSHMGNNNRWAREGGIIDEILVENTYKNPEGNPMIFDVILLDKVNAEENITLLLNTAAYGVQKSDDRRITGIHAFCSQNSTEYVVTANLFCDASGDGILAFLAGAPFRMGAEGRDEFDEGFAPTKEYGELLGHSLYFYTKDTGKPVTYHPPSFAIDDISKIPRFRNFNAKEYGCNLWWIEYGGRLDTIAESETIKWELWKVVYGVWNYIKNSGKFPEAANLALEWVGTIPGKRESRRFEGDFIISQKDIVEQRRHEDAVGFGGWSIDLHPADGVFSEKPGCNQWHSKGIYQIPYRSLYSRGVDNLFLTGRLISATHVAFGSTRVMATGAYLGQVIGHAAALALQHAVLPAAVGKSGMIEQLQTSLLSSGHYIPNVQKIDSEDLAQSATVTASSSLNLAVLQPSTDWTPIESSVAQMLPVKAGPFPQIALQVQANHHTTLWVELRVSSKPGNFTPDTTLEKKWVDLNTGINDVVLTFAAEIPEEQYAFICFMKNTSILLRFSEERITGILSIFNSVNKKVSNFGKQTPPDGIGIDEFEFWCPQRRPEGRNLALQIQPPVSCFLPVNITNGTDRPVLQANAWVAETEDAEPALRLNWERLVKIKRISISFDTDFDHPMESVLMSHPESVMPFCVRNYKVADAAGNIIYQKTGNYQTINIIKLDKVIETNQISIFVEHPSENTPAAVFAVRCYAN